MSSLLNEQQMLNQTKVVPIDWPFSLCDLLFPHHGRAMPLPLPRKILATALAGQVEVFY